MTPEQRMLDVIAEAIAMICLRLAIDDPLNNGRDMLERAQLTRLEIEKFKRDIGQHAPLVRLL